MSGIVHWLYREWTYFCWLYGHAKFKKNQFTGLVRMFDFLPSPLAPAPTAPLSGSLVLFMVSLGGSPPAPLPPSPLYEAVVLKAVLFWDS